METDSNQGREIYSGAIGSNAYEACREVSKILDKLQTVSNIDTELRFDIKVILSELLHNAIKHGNESDNSKKIRLNVWLQENNSVLAITIKDQGCGFDPVSTMNIKYNKIIECDPMNMDESGRGLFIVQNLCDCMEFNSSGNAITVTVKL